MNCVSLPNVTIDNEVFVARTENYSIYTTSVDVAEKFGKRHANVIRDIRDLINNDSSLSKMFYETTYTTKQNKALPCFYITRDGFSLLVMGFTGQDALQWKVKYIRAFNKMEQIIREEVNKLQKVPKPGTKEFLAVALIEAQKVIDDQTKQLEDAKPAIVFHESVAIAENTILIRELAGFITKALQTHNFNVHIGEKKLYEWLRNNGYVIKQKCSSYNLPTAKSTKMGILTIKESVRQGNSGSHTEVCTRVTGKGQEYFIDKFLELYSNGGSI